MHLPAPRTLQAFVAAARLGSLAAASTRVAMSVPALSRRLAALEEGLGVRLFERLPRGVVLTDAGERYLVHAVAILERLEVAAAEVRQDPAIVRVTTIPSLATRWLLPRLPDFTARNPDIHVDVRTSITFERLDGGEYDLAIRLAPDAEMAMAPLLPIHLLPVWSAGHSFAIDRPADILRHVLLGPDHRPEFWQEWLGGAGLDSSAARIRGIDPLLLYEHAVSGAGVAIGVEPLVSGLLNDGRLTGLATHRLRSGRSFFLLEPPTPSTRAGRLLRDWLWRQAHG